ncbi:MAG: hypothetical protein HFJ46_06570 [Clostridia bacterium]|jgi:hypothetical protein|nr:hypothetical protein [Clostridia bacterium]
MTDDINYLEEVNRKIGYASILSKIPESNHKLAIELLNKRDVIKEKNNIFAYWQLKNIDKKIDKLKMQNK